MKQKSLAKWLKLIIIVAVICGAFVYVFIIPWYGASIAAANPEMSDRYVPWLVFLSVTAVPFLAVLAIGWLISADIGKDMSFTSVNAKRLKWICGIAAAAAVYLFAGNIVLLLLNMSHPGVVLLMLLPVFVAAAVSVAAAVLSHLVMKAAELKEQNDLTI